MLPSDDLYIPDGVSIADAFSRTTHLGIAAHPDDLEIMAAHGILECYGRKDRWFFGIIVTDGAGSPRSGRYAITSNQEMVRIRRLEQERAAALGGYSGIAFLNYSSATVKSDEPGPLVQAIQSIIHATKPETIYMHNPFDRHDTHVAVALRTIRAVRKLPMDARPQRLLGCEVWGGLDWLPDNKRVILPLSSHQEIASRLLAAHQSQIAGGKRYDLAVQGRWAANATLSQSHEIDQAAAVSLAMDLTPLIEDENLSVGDYLANVIDSLKQATLNRITAYEKGNA